MMKDNNLEEIKNSIADFLKKKIGQKNKHFPQIYDELLDALQQQEENPPLGRDNDYFEAVKELILLKNEEKWEVLIDIMPRLFTKNTLMSGLTDNISKLLADITEIFYELKNDSEPFNILFPSLIYSLRSTGSVYGKEYINNIKAFEVDSYLFELAQKLYRICQFESITLKNENYMEVEKNNSPDIVIGTFLHQQKVKYEIEKLTPEAKGLLLNTGNSLNKVDGITAFILESLVDLKSGGWGIYIVPHGVLTNQSYEPLRKKLGENFQITSAVELPQKNTINEDTSANASLLIIRKSTEPLQNLLLAQLETKNPKEEKEKLLKEIEQHFKEEIKR